MKCRSWNRNQRRLGVLLRNCDDPLTKQKKTINEKPIRSHRSIVQTDDNPKISSLTFSSFWCPIHGATAASAPPCWPFINASCSLLNSPKMLCRTIYENQLHSNETCQTIFVLTVTTYIVFDGFLYFCSSFVHGWIQKWSEILCTLCYFSCYCNGIGNKNLLILVILDDLKYFYPFQLVQPFLLMVYRLLVILVLSQLLR